jgi:hypothetical protein
MVKVLEKYFKTQYRPADILLTPNARITLKLDLQLKFRNDKNYAYIIVNLRLGLR